MKDQKINCTVDCCVHHDNSCKACSLPSITVINQPDSPTAHYCKQYKKN